VRLNAIRLLLKAILLFRQKRGSESLERAKSPKDKGYSRKPTTQSSKVESTHRA
jgi:hypothetical protein